MTPAATFPYCGAPAVPADLLWRWNLDPWLLAALAAAIVLHWRLAGPERRPSLFFAGWALVLTIFVSPLCALASALFTARSAHHMLLIALVPPLLLMAAPRLLRVRAGAGLLFGLAVLHALVLWAWHAPPAYAAALADTQVYWLMQATLFVTALLLWRGALASDASFGTVAAMVFTFMQTALLGAALAFAARPLYAFHVATTEPWGLSALADQQLAGAVVWSVGGAPYLWAALRAIVRLAGPDAAGAR